MNDPLVILGIAGSLRKESFNRALLRAAQELTPEGARMETLELDGIPPFNQDEETNPHPRVVELKQRVRAADAILFVTPEYNYSIPGVLKNAIDCGSRPYGDSAWSGKPSSSNVSIRAPSGVNSCAARNSERLNDSLRRLPAIPRITNGSVTTPSCTISMCGDSTRI